MSLPLPVRRVGGVACFGLFAAVKARPPMPILSYKALALNGTSIGTTKAKYVYAIGGL